MLTAPEAVAAILDFTTEIALRLGMWLLASGAHGLALGEATCSPNFISPKMYRSLVQPRHAWLVGQLKRVGWDVVGLHICGNIVPIVDDIIGTGVDFLDVDYQVPAATALDLSQGRVALRGNLDPSSVFRFGTVQRVRAETAALRQTVDGHAGWVMSSGCDIPPGTPAENIAAFVEVAAKGRSD